MAATVSVKQATGSGPTNTTITNLRFKTADDPSGTDTTYPLRKPASGFNYSYVASVYLNADTAPSGTINNVKFYTDGSNYSGLGSTLITNGTFDSNINTWSATYNRAIVGLVVNWDSAGRIAIGASSTLSADDYIGCKQSTSTDWGSVTEGVSYTASADFTAEAANTATYNASLFISWRDSSNAEISKPQSTTRSTDGTVTLTATAPTNAVKAYVETRQQATGTGKLSGYWDNIALKASTKTVNGITTSSYSQATGTQGTTGDVSSSVFTSGTNVFTYTSAAPLSVTGSISASTGKITDYLQMQMSVDSAVTTETLTAETFTFRYDET